MKRVCCISFRLLREKITTWVNEQLSLSDVLTTNVTNFRLLQYFPTKELKELRSVSKDIQKR
jgi:hypothetical protein